MVGFLEIKLSNVMHLHQGSGLSLAVIKGIGQCSSLITFIILTVTHKISGCLFMIGFCTLERCVNHSWIFGAVYIKTI